MQAYFKFLSQVVSSFHSSVFRPPSQMFRHKCVTEVTFVKCTAHYFQAQMNSKITMAAFIKLQADKDIKYLLIAEVKCHSYRLHLFSSFVCPVGRCFHPVYQ